VRRRNHLIVVLVVALVGAVAALAVVREPKLGLDLQGGLEVVLQAEAPPGQQVTDDDLDRSISIIRNRIDKIGVAEPELRKQPPNQIIIELPGLKDPEAAAALIGKTAQLQFYDLEADLVPPSITPEGVPAPSLTLYPLLKGIQDELDNGGTPSAWYAYDAKKKLLAGPEPTRQELLAQLPDGKLPEGGEILGVPGNRIILTCGPPTDLCPPGIGPVNRPLYYLFRYQPNDPENPAPEMTGEDLQLRGTRADFGQGGEPIVTLQFTGEGRDKFHAVTRELAQRGEIRTTEQGSAQPIFQHFAIVLDGEIRSFPYIDYTQNPDGINSPSAQITGLSSQAEADDLALVLQTGALPLKFEQVDRTDVSATLGKDSLNEAVIALVGGMIAVALFLLIAYRFLGVVAIIGLVVYGAFLYGAILLFNVTLTLPGFAGLILTIGVAADANIVIFERIKEEVRLGKSVRAAIAAGYRKGFSTIIDANVVTMITAFVIFAVATAGVKGFALMLLIGTVLSMFTAVAATRAMLGLLSGFRWFDNPALMGASALKIPKWQRIDVNSPKRRRIWLSIATALIVLSIISLVVKGLNLGIDFEGGSQVSLTTPQPVEVDRVREVASDVVPANAVIQGRGEPVDGGFTNFQIRTEPLEQAEQDQLAQSLEQELGAEVSGVRNVSGSFSSQIARGAILAIIVSFALITLYITFRFQWRFAIPILRTFVNDLVITMGIYSLSGRELTTATVAALLTILGYSIYDTIIVFDRIRENMPLMRRSSFVAIANQSIWETIRRSIATSVITLLPVVALLLFGGDTLKDFAFALLVGIGLGAVSTIFVATPFLTVIMERTPEFAKRKGLDAPEEKLLEPLPEAAAATAAGRLAQRLRRPVPAVVGAAEGAEDELEAEAPDEPVAAGLEEPADAAPDEAVPETAAPETAAPETAAPESAPSVPESAPAPAQDPAARRDARRQRRRTRPHGRAR
jgi:SecD/SecF fusion protein